MSSRSDWRHRGVAVASIMLAGACVLGAIIYTGRLTPVPLSWIFGEASADDSKRVSVAVGMDPAPANSKRVGSDWQKRQVANMAYISAISTHHPMDRVIRTLGKPDFEQAYNNGVEVLMYRTRQERSDFRTTKEETAILVFQHGELIGMNNSKDWFELDRIRAKLSDYRAEQSDNKRKIRELSIGDRRSAILAKLGQPDFLDYPADDLEIFAYRTHSVALDGFTDRNETTRLMLRDGVLLAVGE
ncbi:MAG: DUF3192 domain-containing protein [Gammaproteobacteria bacterium]|nr:DUF3192 domain-containing protein [Gammaproteobacteria bacterium]